MKREVKSWQKLMEVMEGTRVEAQEGHVQIM